MNYIIQKTVHGKWKYWLDKGLKWNGLKDNAKTFSEDYGRAILHRFNGDAIKLDEILLIKLEANKLDVSE